MDTGGAEVAYNESRYNFLWTSATHGGNGIKNEFGRHDLHVDGISGWDDNWLSNDFFTVSKTVDGSCEQDGVLQNYKTCTQISSDNLHSCVERMYSTTRSKRMVQKPRQFEYEKKPFEITKNGDRYSWEDTKCIGGVSSRSTEGTLEFNDGSVIEFKNTGRFKVSKTECGGPPTVVSEIILKSSGIASANMNESECRQYAESQPGYNTLSTSSLIFKSTNSDESPYASTKGCYRFYIPDLAQTRVIYNAAQSNVILDCSQLGTDGACIEKRSVYSYPNLVEETAAEFPLGCSYHYTNVDDSPGRLMWKEYYKPKSLGFPDESMTEGGCKEYSVNKGLPFATIRDTARPYGCLLVDQTTVAFNRLMRYSLVHEAGECTTIDILLLNSEANTGTQEEKISRCAILCESRSDCEYFKVDMTTFECSMEQVLIGMACEYTKNDQVNTYRPNQQSCSSSNNCIINDIDTSNDVHIVTESYFSSVYTFKDPAGLVPNDNSVGFDRCRQYALENGFPFENPRQADRTVPYNCFIKNGVVYFNPFKSYKTAACFAGYYNAQFNCEIYKCGDPTTTPYFGEFDGSFGFIYNTADMCCTSVDCLQALSRPELFSQYNRRVCKFNGELITLDHPSDTCETSTDIPVVCATSVVTELDNLKLYEVEKDDGVCLESDNVIFAFSDEISYGSKVVNVGGNDNSLSETDCIKYSQEYGYPYSSNEPSETLPEKCILVDGKIFYNTASSNILCSSLHLCIQNDKLNKQLCLASGDADEGIQGTIEEALTASGKNCSSSKYYDLLTGSCKSAEERPMIEATFYDNSLTFYEKSATVTCEVLSNSSVACAKCACFSDVVSGFWGDYECSNCAKYAGNRQCNKQCPGGENVCNGNGKCLYGSDSERDIFQPAECYCGQDQVMATPSSGECYFDSNPKTNTAYFSYIKGDEYWSKTEAQEACCELDDFGQVVNDGYCYAVFKESASSKYILGMGVVTDRRTYYNLWTKKHKTPVTYEYEFKELDAQQTVLESKPLVCKTKEEVFDSGSDHCNHFDKSAGDCSKCEEGFNGKDCKYRCQKCLLGGACDEKPSDKNDATCSCPAEVSGLWNKNCCPSGFRVDNILQWESLSAEEILNIKIPQVYTSNTDNELDASYWCRPCPGIDSSDWLNLNAAYKVCTGNGECVADSQKGENICNCLEGFKGRSCACVETGNTPYVNDYTVYSCSGNSIQCPTNDQVFYLTNSFLYTKEVRAWTTESSCSYYGNFIDSLGQTFFPTTEQITVFDQTSIGSRALLTQEEWNLLQTSGAEIRMGQVATGKELSNFNFGDKIKYMVLAYENEDILPLDRLVEPVSTTIKVTERKMEIEVCYPVMALDYTFEYIETGNYCSAYELNINTVDLPADYGERVEMCARACTARPNCEYFFVGHTAGSGACYYGTAGSTCTRVASAIYDIFRLKTTTVGTCYKSKTCTPTVPCHLGEGPCGFNSDCAVGLECRSGSVPGFNIADVGSSYKYCAIPTSQASYGNVCAKKPDEVHYLTSTSTANLNAFTPFSNTYGDEIRLRDANNENIQIPYKGGRIPFVNGEYKIEGTWGKYVPLTLDGDNKLIIHDREYDCPAGFLGVYGNMFIGNEPYCTTGSYDANKCSTYSPCGGRPKSVKLSTSDVSGASKFHAGRCMACPAGYYSSVTGLSGLTMTKQTTFTNGLIYSYGYGGVPRWTLQTQSLTFPAWTDACTKCPLGSTSGVGARSALECFGAHKFGNRAFKRAHRHHNHYYNYIFGPGNPRGKIGDDHAVDPRQMEQCPLGYRWDGASGLCKGCSGGCYDDGTNCVACVASNDCVDLDTTIGGQTFCRFTSAYYSYCYTKTGPSGSNCAFTYVVGSSDTVGYN